MTLPRFQFLPGLEIDSAAVPNVVPIKGQIPRLTYPFSLKSIYPATPSVTPLQSYRTIREVLASADRLLAGTLHARAPQSLPRATSEDEALAILGVLFDPTAGAVEPLWRHLEGTITPRLELFDTVDARPFPLRLASTWKLEHTLAWADTNVKIEIERVCAQAGIANEHAVQLAESALTIYSLVMKQQDYWLARSANLNHSMFLQERTLGLLFGDSLMKSPAAQLQSTLSNRIALDLLRGFAAPTLHQLSTASIFMGVLWSSDSEIQRRYQLHADSVLGDFDSDLRRMMADMAMDDFDLLARDLEAAPLPELVLVLDDNGESVFDVALAQQLLREHSDLTVSFIVNRWPVSNNISQTFLLEVLGDPHFSDLRREMTAGRVNLIVEEQAFRSFEHRFMSERSAQALMRARAVYIKGANFFETLQLHDSVTYHAFTAYGDMSVTLTGFAPGSGVLVRTPVGRTAFEYRGPRDITTLSKMLQERQGA